MQYETTYNVKVAYQLANGNQIAPDKVNNFVKTVNDPVWRKIFENVTQTCIQTIVSNRAKLTDLIVKPMKLTVNDNCVPEFLVFVHCVEFLTAYVSI